MYYILSLVLDWYIYCIRPILVIPSRLPCLLGLPAGHRELLAAGVKAAGGNMEGCFEITVQNADKVSKARCCAGVSPLLCIISSSHLPRSQSVLHSARRGVA